MSTLVYDAKFRPVRVGWCVRAGDMNALITAFRLNHCFWGGRFNPIIVVDDSAQALHLTEIFNVDILHSVTDDAQCQNFIKSVKHLPSDLTFHDGLFRKHGEQKTSVILDAYHPARLLYEDHIKNNTNPKEKVNLFRWDQTDPCANIFEAMIGSFPQKEDVGVSYKEIILKNQIGVEIQVSPEALLDKIMIQTLTPNGLTTLQLDRRFDFEIERYPSGVFVGNANSFSDLVNFWNLRAADINLIFFDIKYANRLKPLVEELENTIKSLPPHFVWKEHALEIWTPDEPIEAMQSYFLNPIVAHRVDLQMWGDNKGMRGIRPPVMYFSEHSVVAQISESEKRQYVTLQIGAVPGFNEKPHNYQKLVVTLKPALHFSGENKALFNIPFIPEMNEYFGRQHHIGFDGTRANRDGLGIITDLGKEYLTLYGLDRISFFKELFKTFGISATTSSPGLICNQLIRQMGGLQGCRVFKIRGVRQLIEKFKPNQSFTRSAAIGLIRDVDAETSKPNFNVYERLYLERRESDRLKPEDAFIYLLKQGVFRVGLGLKCDICQLQFWRSLDDVQAEMICEYCGRTFNSTLQLKDRDWAYRPTGLFGREDHQEGGVPVALTMQQLDTTLHSEIIAWTSAMKLEPLTAQIDNCETDFVLISQNMRGQVELAIGECKANLEITERDVKNLSRVADALQTSRLDVYIIFSKTGQFSPEEIKRCRAADTQFRRRTILLSSRELEPYNIYERAAEEFVLHDGQYAHSFKDMVNKTREIYFEPQPKKI